LLCSLAALSEAPAVQAQISAEEKATAEAVFEEGMRLIKQGNFAEACPKFEMSQRVEPAVGTMLYLAECYEKTNRTASAWAMFREAASLAETSGQVDRMKTAQARAARLEPRLAWLTLDVAKEALVPGLQIRRNGVLVSAELSGTATPVDPGEVTVEAAAPGHLPFSTKVKVAAKGRVSVAIPALQAAPELTPPPAAALAAAVPAQPENAPPAAASAASSSAAPASSSPKAAPVEQRSPVPWIVGGAGVVALGVGTVFGLKAMSNADDARTECPNGVCNSEQGQKDADAAHTQATISNVSFVLGAAAIATGAVLYFTLSKQKTQVGVLPLFDQSSVGLAVRGKLEL
jgi:serine/threonine-protein kinase